MDGGWRSGFAEDALSDILVGFCGWRLVTRFRRRCFCILLVGACSLNVVCQVLQHIFAGLCGWVLVVKFCRAARVF